jgi:signal-transduction protein with cAMP-binding, CBS, and nucleotidyltransferase domain
MAETHGLDELLNAHPFFANMDQRILDELAGCARNERFDDGDVVFSEGGFADRLFIIRHGQVAVQVAVPGRGPVVLETLHADDILGWSWLVPPYRWTFDARAVGLLRAVSLDAVCLRAKMETDSELGYHLLNRFVPIMGERLRAARLQLLDPSPSVA